MDNNNNNTHIMKFSLFFKIILFRDIYFLTPQSNVVFFRELSITEYLFNTWDVPKQRALQV